jgi:hypothetical protein
MAVIRCDRCNRRYRKQDDWNVIGDKGAIVGYLCPDCQTPDENAQAEFNAATLNYSRDSQGRDARAHYAPATRWRGPVPCHGSPSGRAGRPWVRPAGEALGGSGRDVAALPVPMALVPRRRCMAVRARSIALWSE